MPAARTAAEAGHRAIGFSPAEFFADEGIEADLATYVETAAP
jgi:hypothetical protein